MVSFRPEFPRVLAQVAREGEEALHIELLDPRVAEVELGERERFARPQALALERLLVDRLLVHVDLKEAVALLLQARDALLHERAPRLGLARRVLPGLQQACLEHLQEGGGRAKAVEVREPGPL